MHARLLLSLIAVPAAAVAFSAIAQAQPTLHHPHSTTHKETSSTAVEHRLLTELHAVVVVEERLVDPSRNPLAKDSGALIRGDLRGGLDRP